MLCRLTVLLVASILILSIYMEELVVKRIQGLDAPDVTQWAANGFIASICRGELLFIKPKIKSVQSMTTHDSNIAYQAAEQMSELYATPQRISGEFNKSANLLLDIYAFNEEIRPGQSNLEHSPVEIRWSPTNYSNDYEPLLAVTTDTMHCFIMERMGSKWSIKVNVLQEVMKLLEDQMDFKKYLKVDQLAQLRINSFSWFEDINTIGVQDILLPVTTKFFTIVTESHKMTIYQLLDSNTISAKLNFKISLEQGEFGINAKCSKWLLLDYSSCVCYLSIITNQNRVLLKRLVYNFNSQNLSADEKTFILKQPDHRPVSVLNFWNSCYNLEYSFLGFSFTNGFKFVKIDRLGDFKTYESINLGSYVLFNSLSIYGNTESKTAQMILSDSYKNIITMSIELENLEIASTKVFDYYDPHPTKNNFMDMLVPLVQHKQKIISVTVDSRGLFALVGLSSTNPATTIDLSGVKGKELKFTILPLFNYTSSSESIDILKSLKDQNVFWNGMFSKYTIFELTKSFVESSTQINEFFQSIHQNVSLKGGVTNKAAAKKVTLESLPALLKDSMYFSNETNNLATGVCLSLSSDTKVNDPEFNTNCKHSILMILAQIITQVNPSELKSFNDLVCYYSWVAFLKKNSRSNAATTSSLDEYSSSTPLSLYIEDIEEVEHFSNFKSEDFDLKFITSEEGHSWTRCSLTLTPLISASVKICRESESVVRCNTDEGDVLVKIILESLPLCIFSGSRYETQ